MKIMNSNPMRIALSLILVHHLNVAHAALAHCLTIGCTRRCPGTIRDQIMADSTPKRPELDETMAMLQRFAMKV